MLTKVIESVSDEIIHPEILKILLKDNTTGFNITWATSNYLEYGECFSKESEITLDLISGKNSAVIHPRVDKEREEQSRRTREKAEVFTPSWICNIQNNLIDESWFGEKNVFNQSKGTGWITNPSRIKFPITKPWQQYVDEKRLEACCGEAPYLVSRYDTVSGKAISIPSRIGLLDRKLRVVNENCLTSEEWIFWVVRAFQSIYAYEFQGDNLLLARENLFLSSVEYFIQKNKIQPALSDAKKIADIIAWNLWQMDGVTLFPPSVDNSLSMQLSLFDDLPTGAAVAKPCMIFDWESNKKIEFRALLHGVS